MNEQPSLRLRHFGCNMLKGCADAGVYCLDDEEACWCVFMCIPPHPKNYKLVLPITRSHRSRQLSSHNSVMRTTSVWTGACFTCSMATVYSTLVVKRMTKSQNNHFDWLSLQPRSRPSKALQKKRLPNTTRLLEFEKCNIWMSTNRNGCSQTRP